MGKIKILSPGLYTTIQASKRKGLREFGISTSGATDKFAYKVSNALVGNEEELASLEITISGPEIRFDGSELISICGGAFSPCINNIEIPQWTAIKVNKNDILSFKGTKSGARAYISFAGGIEAEEVLGSYSTNIKARFGGFFGRSLKGSDELNILTKKNNLDEFNNSALLQEYIPQYSSKLEVRVILGPQDDYFSQEEVDRFFSESYRISPMWDRMGIRLEGRALTHNKSANIISDGNNIGSIQVPGDGHPIILMNDGGTTGGYPKIATITYADLDKVAQLKMNDEVKFKKISLEEGHECYREYVKNLNSIDKMITKKNSVFYYKVKVNSKEYEVSVEKIGC